jgi:hypothetical protein
VSRVNSIKRLPRLAAAAALPLCALALAAAAATAAERMISRSEAAAVAGAISLRQGDLPGYAGSSNPVTAQERKQGDQVAACDGGTPESDALAVAQSPYFSPRSNPNSLTVSSSSEILASAQLVAKDLKAVEGPRGTPCLASELKPQLEATLGKGSSASITSARLPSVVSGADGSFSLAFTVSLSIKQGKTTVKVPLYADLIGFAYGQAEVGLDVIATGGEKPSTSLERRLAGVLLARAKAAIG